MSKSARKSAKSVAPAQVVEVAQVEATTPVEATSAPAVESPAKPAKVRYAARVWAPADIITVNTPNPKSGASKARYALYTSGMSVSDYASAVVGLGGKNTKTLANADLRWDVARGFITIEPKA